MAIWEDRVSVSLLEGKVHLCHVASGQQIDYSTFAPWRQKFILIANISILSVKNSYGLATGQQFDLWRQEFMNFENQQFNPWHIGCKLDQIANNSI